MAKKVRAKDLYKHIDEYVKHAVETKDFETVQLLCYIGTAFNINIDINKFADEYKQFDEFKGDIARVYDQLGKTFKDYEIEFEVKDKHGNNKYVSLPTKDFLAKAMNQLQKDSAFIKRNNRKDEITF